MNCGDMLAIATVVTDNNIYFLELLIHICFDNQNVYTVQYSHSPECVLYAFPDENFPTRK